jgi:hypothetical protein
MIKRPQSNNDFGAWLGRDHIGNVVSGFSATHNLSDMEHQNTALRKEISQNKAVLTKNTLEIERLKMEIQHKDATLLSFAGKYDEAMQNYIKELSNRKGLFKSGGPMPPIPNFHELLSDAKVNLLSNPRGGSVNHTTVNHYGAAQTDGVNVQMGPKVAIDLFKGKMGWKKPK